VLARTCNEAFTGGLLADGDIGRNRDGEQVPVRPASQATQLTDGSMCRATSYCLTEGLPGQPAGQTRMDEARLSDPDGVPGGPRPGDTKIGGREKSSRPRGLTGRNGPRHDGVRALGGSSPGDRRPLIRGHEIARAEPAAVGHCRQPKPR